MDLTALAKNLRKQAATNSTLILDDTVFASSVLDDIRTAFALPAGKNLTVKGVRESDVPAHPTGGVLEISAGTASMLNQTAVGIGLTFTAPGGSLEAVITGTMGEAWKFSDSFEGLDFFPFDELNTSDAQFVYATTEHRQFEWPGDPSFTIDLAPGLNFLSGIKLDSFPLLAGLLGIGSTAVKKFYGPFAPTRGQALPVGEIRAPLNSSGFTIGKTPFDLTLSSPAAAVRIGKSQPENLLQAIDLVVLADLQNTLEFAVGIPTSGSRLSVNTKPLAPGESIKNLIKSLPGGSDWENYIPAELEDIFAEVGLDNFSMIFDLGETKKVSFVGLAISTVKPWEIIKDVLILEGSKLHIQFIDPTGLNWTKVSIKASADFLPHVFKGEFDFSVELDKTSEWEIDTISGVYFGNVNLGELVEGLVGSKASVPSELQDVVFSDFGVTVINAGSAAVPKYTYTLFGSLEFAFPMLGTELTSQVTLTVSKSGSDYAIDLNGSIVIGEESFSFTLDISKSQSGTDAVIEASWESLDSPLELEDIANAFGFDIPHVPPSLDLALKSASLTYDFSKKRLVLAAESVNYGKAVFAAIDVATEDEQQAEKKWEFFFLVEVDKKFSLSNLPLVGKELASIENIEVGEFKVVIGSVPATKEIADTVNTLINALPNGPYPNLPVPEDGKPTGKVTLSAEVDFGNQPPLPISISLGGGSTRDARPLLPTTGAAVPSEGALTTASSATSGGEVTKTTAPDGTTWFDVQKSFGPVSIQRIGVLYQSSAQALWFEIDASLAFGPLSLSLTGLGIGSGLKDFTPEFSLHGLGVAYSEPPLTIAGELVNLAPAGAQYIQLEGGLVISTGEFTVAVFGYYGDESGFNSMFIFGDIAYDFGGPPAFFVTGLALGFGYNSTVTIPTIDEVATFPFIQVLPTSAVPNTNLLGGPNPSPLEVLNKILDPTFHSPAWVREEKGSLWFAAGITFTSFELVNSQALLMVDVGSELVIALVGTSRAQFPQAGGEVTYANIELDLLLRFAPSEGVFSLQAVLASSSFLLDKACVLTGGFAFFVWFEGSPDSPGSKHAGDFVLTLGGYNPGFTPPAHYPTVPPVGFHWTMDSTITIQGGAYFALTPAALMVGGNLQATYQSGHIKAWFDAHADVIIRWKPFWFDADIGLTIGASYTIDWGFTTSTISIEVGCELEFWGPPTGGSVTIDLYVISVTIPFGTPKNNTQQIKGWADVEQMLPNTGSSVALNVLKLSPTTGLIPDGTAPLKNSRTARTPAGVEPESAPPNDAHWVVRGTMFSFSTSSSIPATTATIGGARFSGDKFNVYPLVKLNSRWNNISSALAVKIQSLPDNTDCSSSFEAVGVQSGVPAALWGTPPEDQSGNPQVPDAKKLVVPNQLTGVSVQVKAPQVGSSAGHINVQTNLKFDELNLKSAVLPLSGKAAPAGDIPANSPVTVSTIVKGITSTEVSGARDAIFKALREANYAPDTNDSMTRFRDQIGCTLSAEPLLVN